MLATDHRLDPLQQQAEEQIFPIFVVAQPDVGGGGQGSERWGRSWLVDSVLGEALP